MAHLIDKDALVAEIEKITEEPAPSHDSQCPWEDGYYCGLYKAESIIDTLEVKEVDLEKYYHDFLQKEWFDKNCNRTMSEMMAFTAKHFFELGLKAQKEYEDDQDTTRPRHES